MVLINEIKKPIHIVLCGVNNHRPPHPDYLLLAKKTNGTLHTMTQSLNYLSQINEGQIVSFCGFKFVFSKNKFTSLLVQKSIKK
jgi:hypothetical protein